MTNLWSVLLPMLVIITGCLDNVDSKRRELQAPTDLAAEAISPFSIRVSWKDPNQVRGKLTYTIIYKVVPEQIELGELGENEQIEVMNTDFVLIDKLLPLTTYVFVVMVSKGRSKSPHSTSVMNTTNDPLEWGATLEAPVLLRVVGHGDGVKVVARTTGYSYNVYYTKNKTLPLEEWSVTQQRTIRLPEPYKKYYFRVTTQMLHMESPPSNIVSYPEDCGVMITADSPSSGTIMQFIKSSYVRCRYRFTAPANKKVTINITQLDFLPETNNESVPTKFLIRESMVFQTFTDRDQKTRKMASISSRDGLDLPLIVTSTQQQLNVFYTGPSTVSGHFLVHYQFELPENVSYQHHEITKKAPEFLSKPRNASAQSGSPSFLVCSVYGYPKPVISWLKDGNSSVAAVIEGRLLETLMEGVFFISSTVKEDAGTYTCVAENWAGRITADAVLTVLVPPTFIEKPEDIETTEGNDVTLRCRADGVPKPEIKWKKLKYDIVPNDKYLLSEGGEILTINNVNKDDSSTYICEINSPMDTSFRPEFARAKLEVTRVPDESRVPPQVESLTVIPRSDAIHIMWEPPDSEQGTIVRGYILGIGKNLPDVVIKELDSNKLSYTYVNVRPSASYVIKLRAFNQAGEGAPVYKIVEIPDTDTVDSRPLDPPFAVKLQTTGPTTMIVAFMAPDGADGKVMYTVRYTPSYPLNVKLINTTETTLTLTNLKPYTVYEVSVKRTTIEGSSRYSIVSFNKTFEDAPSSPPSDPTLVLSEYSCGAIIVNWLPPAKPNGIINAYMIMYSINSDLGDSDWVVEVADGGDLTRTIHGLVSSTRYYFKMKGRTSKGWGPVSNTVSMSTGRCP
ncbi:protogenin-like [Antedon mediterranea]|uniref:protogenin-like n=1 Tax=Antedon mediterranea TaxID=105859 RepID=UPI003AF4F260